MKPTEEKIQSNASDLPVYLFKQGNNCEAYRYFGAHMETRAGEAGVVFRVWAPHAVAISVVGDFNSWKPGSHPMRKVDGDSVWELFIPVQGALAPLPFYFFTFLLFNEFPISMGKVVYELPSSFGPYEIGMGVGSAHLLLSSIALRVKEGAVAGAALG